jgi:hypothetical protein
MSWVLRSDLLAFSCRQTRRGAGRLLGEPLGDGDTTLGDTRRGAGTLGEELRIALGEARHARTTLGEELGRSTGRNTKQALGAYWRRARLELGAELDQHTQVSAGD